MNKVIKPWGSYLDFIREHRTVLKEIIVFQGKRLSLQSHKKRQEHWIVIQGSGIATLGDKIVSISLGNYIFVDKEKIHRIENNGSETLKIIEVQLGECSEEDIIRYEDDYRRD